MPASYSFMKEQQVEEENINNRQQKHDQELFEMSLDSSLLKVFKSWEAGNTQGELVSVS